MAFPDSAGATVNVTNQVEPTPIQNNVTATTPADLTTTNLYGARLFGNGADGDATIPAGSTVTLTRDMFYNSLIVDGTLCTGGYMIQIANTLTVNQGGRIHNDGGAGSDAVQGSTSLIPVGGFGGLAGRFYSGGNGAAGAGYGSGAASGASSSVNSGSNDAAYLPGGRGGGGSGTTSGGTAYNGGGSPAPRNVHELLFMDSQNIKTQKFAGGGGGGAGGHVDPAGIAGSGGGGGGVVVIFARYMTNNGIISAVGGNGGAGAASKPTPTYLYQGCGGGGGGGIIVLAYTTYQGNLPLVSGGNVGIIPAVTNMPTNQGSAGTSGWLVEMLVKS